jgi:hypothetical protein
MATDVTKPKYVRKKCEHNRYKFQCKDCKGSSICEHGNQKGFYDAQKGRLYRQE